MDFETSSNFSYFIAYSFLFLVLLEVNIFINYFWELGTNWLITYLTVLDSRLLFAARDAQSCAILRFISC